MRLSAKVLVIGGGPAGSTAARFLAENGVDVILLEKNPSFVKPCGGGVPLTAFKELNIPKTIIKKEINSIGIFSPSGERINTELTDGSIAIVERGDFDRVLRNKAELQGARVIEGEFTGIINDKICRIEAYVERAKTEIVSEYIIAADGVNSKVRTALGIKPSRAIFTVSENIKGGKTEFCEFWFGSSHAPGFYSWVFPSAKGILTGTGSLEPGNINILLERFKKRRGIIAEGCKRLYRIPMWEGNLYNKGKVIFAGDSAGHVMPLVYEGIYYAMKAGEFAARAIIEEKIDNYKSMWKDRFHKGFTLMDKLKDHFLKDDASVERLVALYRRPEIQELSLRLWIKKDSSTEILKDYIKLFGKFLL